MCSVKNVAAIAMAAALTAIANGIPVAAAAQPVVQPPPPAAPAAQPAPSDAALANRPAVAERVTFKEAVERALARNPSIEQAAADILRADALVRLARASALRYV